jgi:hypothetical protein
MSTELEGHASDLLEAMYDADRVGTDQDEAIATYLQQNDLAGTYGYTLISFLDDHGMVREHNTYGRAGGAITPAGIHAIQQLRTKRASPKVRAALLRREMLTWLDGQEERGAGPNSFDDFAASLESADDAFTERELRGAAEYLQRHQLIEAVHVEESSDGWVGPLLTVDGRECISDYDGDVGEYLRDRRGGGPTADNSTTVYISDNNGNLSINGERFTQNYKTGLDVAALLEFAGGVRQMLPVLGMDVAAQGDLAKAADELHAEASSRSPDHGHLRQLVKRLQAGLKEAAPTVAKTMLLAASDAAAKAITRG